MKKILIIATLITSLTVSVFANIMKQTPKKIAVGADPFAYEMKKNVIEHLQKRGVVVVDMDSYANTPYFEIAEKTGKAVSSGEVDGAVLFCGTGAGMCVVANKVKGVCAVSVESVFSAQKAKAINNANVITMGSMIVGNFMACQMVDAWLDTKFTQGFEPLSDFLNDAVKSVSKIDENNRK